jgi:glycerophosphoryl diester phosphodiesterase
MQRLRLRLARHGGTPTHRRIFFRRAGGTPNAPLKCKVIAHRGASGRMPDHTLAGYEAAFNTGCDFIEIDAHASKDGELVANHDIELSETTDVANWEWARDRNTRVVAKCYDGEEDQMEGWIIPDFTLEELKRLRVKMRSSGRDQQFNLQFEIPTVAETCELVQGLVEDIKRASVAKGKSWGKTEWLQERNRFTLSHGHSRGNLNVGLYIETKRPSWYRGIGLPLEERLVKTIEDSSFTGPVIIQSFEDDSLRRIRELKPEWPRVRLLTDEVGDLLADGTIGEYLDFVKHDLKADGIGPWKGSIIPDPSHPPDRSVLVDEAHRRELFVHPYTFRSDVLDLDLVYGGNASQEFSRFFDLGVDGVFADFPSHAVFARELYNRAKMDGHDLTFKFKST